MASSTSKPTATEPDKAALLEKARALRSERNKLPIAPGRLEPCCASNMPCIDIIIIIVIDVSNSTARKQLIQEILDGDALSTIVIGETGSGKTTRTCVTHHVM
jgi:hypothetical protein